MNGFIYVFRMLASHWVWRNTILGHHWVDLLMYAQWEDEKSVFFGGKQVLLKRGQQVTTTRLLTARWNTNPKMVLKTLEIFENEKMIECMKDNRMTIISICKYDDYQTMIEGKFLPKKGYDSAAMPLPKKSKRKRSGKQTEEDNNTTIEKDKQIIVVDDEEKQKIISEVFLSENKIKEGCDLFKITPDKYIELVGEVVKDWKFINLKEWTFEHLRNAIRVKLKKSNQNLNDNANFSKKAKENKRDDGRAGTGQDVTGNPLERVAIRSSKKGSNKS